MSVEDQFTSIQWDREEVDNSHSIHETIPEESSSNNIEASKTPKGENNKSEDNNNHSDGDKENEEQEEEDINSTTTTFVNEEQPHQLKKANDELQRPSEPNKSTNSELNSFEKYFIDSTVTSPIRDLDSSSKPYISYLLTTNTNNPSIIKLSSEKSADKITIKIRRRYGDFRFLHECLINDYPQLMIPPLPSKSNFKYLTGDTFSTEFVHKRLHSLNRFVKFILNHKDLSQSSIFGLFISDSPDWATFTKNLKISKIDNSSEESGGFVNKVVNDELLTETVMNFLTPSKHKRETNKDILDINDKLKKLYENLIRLDRIFSKLNKKNSDLSLDYEHFSNQISKLSILQSTNSFNETDYSSENQQNNKIVEGTDELAIANNFKIFAESLSFYSKSWANLHSYIDETFLVSLKDSSKYIISLTNLIQLQHNKNIDLQVLQEYLNKSRSELASMDSAHNTASSSYTPPVPINTSHNGGIVNNTTQLIKDTLSTSATGHIGSATTESKIQKLQNKVNQLENEIKLQTKLVNDLTYKIVNEEYPHWDRFNKNELKEAMLGLCNEEVKFYKGLIDDWSDVESKLLKRLDELK